MADNVAITAGSGTTIGADEVADGTLGTVKVQFVKLMDGTLDGTAKAAVGANGLAADVKASVLPTGASTAAKQPALGTAGTASTDVISVQGIASMTKLLVTPDSVALPANQSVNVNQLAGTTTDTNSGTKSAGTLRVVLATDQPQLTNKLLVTPDANSAVNLAQAAGNTLLVGNGVTGTGSPRVTIASDNSSNTNPFLVQGGGDGTKATYSAAATQIAAAASATDIFTIFGSGTKTVRIVSLTVTGVQTTSGVNTVIMGVRSTANSGGTGTAQTNVPHDSASAAGTAVVTSYTANPTTGSLVGVVRSEKLTIAAPAGTGVPYPAFRFGVGPEQAIVLRGTGQGLCVNLNGVTITGGSFNFDVTWIEDNS